MVDPTVDSDRLRLPPRHPDGHDIDFGGGDKVTLLNLSSTAGLEDDISIV